MDNVEPAVARDIHDLFPEIITEYRAVREYPGRSLASNIVGVANWRTDDPNVKKHNLHGLSGLESLRDTQLSGTPGRQVVDTEEGSQSVVIPGTERDLVPATDGSDVELTIDADLQYHLQQSLAAYVVTSQAKNASAVVLDAHTGEVYAMANDKAFDPTSSGGFDLKTMGNPAVVDAVRARLGEQDRDRAVHDPGAHLRARRRAPGPGLDQRRRPHRARRLGPRAPCRSRRPASSPSRRTSAR